MSERVTFSVKVDDEVADNFRSFVKEHKGKIRGELGREVENALIEYMDNDRTARLETDHERIESKLDSVLAAVSDGGGTHTHKRSASPTTVVEKAEVIASRIKENADGRVFPVATVEREIKAVAGADDRTLEQYKRELKEMNAAFAHPNSDSAVWTTDKEEWSSWAESHINGVPDAEVTDMIEPYDIGFEEYDRLVTTAVKV